VRLYIASDFHIHDDDPPRLYTRAKEALFLRVVDDVVQTKATLLLAGDILDLTGMQPPAKGLAEFFAAAAPGRPLAISPQRTVSERVCAAAARFPETFAALGGLARTGRLWLMPGNHDCGIDDPSAVVELAQAMGIDAVDLVFRATFRIDDFFFAAHGNQFDSSNQTNGNCSNAGMVIAASLYHALGPALQALDVDAAAIAAIPCVRPEENVVSGLVHYLGDAAANRVLLAFVKLLEENNYFHDWSAITTWVGVHLFPGSITRERVRAALKDDSEVAAMAKSGAEKILAGHALIPRGHALPKVVVLGHTHELDASPSYVNLGTWIDHVRGLLPAELAAVDRTLPVLIVEGEAATLHDVRDLVTKDTVAECATLWQRGDAAISRPADRSLPDDNV